MVRIITANLNGIRSAASKGFFDWLSQQQADVVCLQEIKAQVADLPPDLLAPAGFHGFFHCAEKKGYSGVAVYTRHRPRNVILGMESAEFDAEGRYIQVDFDTLSVVSVYLPSGSSSDLRQQAKFRFLDEFAPRLEKLRSAGRECVICGDWNIAHQNIDLKNWRANQKNSGFLPEERAWLTHMIGEMGWVDVFRRLNSEPEQYTWWSNRGQAWAKNVGWRIDYHVATPLVGGRATAASIYKDQRFSDHAPLTIDYDFVL